MMRNRFDHGSETYGRLIRHLGICEECQERLHAYDEKQDLENHLIDDED
jgi:hypothetical protein